MGMGEKRLKPVPGAKVRLLRDVTTRGYEGRGQRTFRKDLVMTIRSDSGCFYLTVWVRAKEFALQLQKKDYPRYFEVVSVPPKAEGEGTDGSASH